jgi:y4mF family transcriptional regulator
MAESPRKKPVGNEDLRNGVVVRSSNDVGNIARTVRREQGLTQLDIAGIANTGNRFIIELEQGKPTVQLQKVLDALALVGLEVVLRRKGS